MSVFALLLGLIYASIQIYLLHHWNIWDGWQIPENFIPKTSVSIIIPARNESENIEACLRSIANQQYPVELFEIIVVDDYSEDDTVARIRDLEEPAISIIELKAMDLPATRAHKKRALELGIMQSTSDLIITTDADVEVGGYWIATIVSFFEAYSPSLVTGPVLFSSGKTSFQRFQALDFMGMMGVTGGGIASGLFHMSNGANMSFTRAAYESVNGYDGVDHIASGDDILLTQKMIEHGLSVRFLKCKHAIVETQPVSNITDFYNQRLRWGAKSEHYHEKAIVWVQFVVLITCLSILAFLFLTPLRPIKYIWPLCVLWGIKIAVDYYCLKSYSKFFDRQDLLKAFGISQIYHVLYISIIGLLSVFVRKYTWKGREVK
ncbi:MAG: DUF3307 domain-containing protein [Bacteroidia bacterium]|nr:DUF3307 domain-containing protein [Bacteroidia bacterium]